MDQPVKLFVYGILKNKDTLQNIIGRPWKGKYTSGFVLEYRIINTSPKYIIPAEGEIAEGLIVDGLTEADLVPIDRVEGTEHDHYQRVEVMVWDHDGREHECQMYLAGKHRRQMLKRQIQESIPANVNGVSWKPTRFIQKAAEAAAQVFPESDKFIPLKRERPTALSAAKPKIPADQREVMRKLEHKELDDETLPLFAYGNLTFREVLEERLGHPWKGDYEPCYLDGWRIISGWPRHAIPAPGKRAYGMLLRHLTERDLQVIDGYEGVHSDTYRRILVKINGRWAWAYAIGERGKRRVQEKLAQEAARPVPVRQDDTAPWQWKRQKDGKHALVRIGKEPV